MSSVLGQLAMAVGGIMFILSMIFSLTNGVSMLPALYRAVMVMCLCTIIVVIFFRFFTRLLYRFVNDRMKEQAEQQAKAKEAAPKTGAAARAPAGNPAPK